MQDYLFTPTCAKIRTMREFVKADSQGKRRTYLEIECTGCGTSFHRLKKDVNRSRRNGVLYDYCSVKCRSISTGKYTTVVCAFCGKETEKAVSKLANSKHGIYFCNRECKDKGQRVENGITEIHPPHYHDGANYYSKLARNTHGNRCADCGNSFEPFLSVHHIDGNRENFSLDNLEVLCYNHHILRHLRLTEQGWVLDWKVLTPRESLTHLIEESLTIVTARAGSSTARAPDLHSGG